ncbi:MAG: Uma2 family endonuclease [Chitinophagales bacterium]
MSAVKLKEQYISIEEYLAFEEKSEAKHEYENGQIFAMSGGTPNHAFIGSSTVSALRNALKAKGSKCRVSGSELKIHIEKYNSFVYPDAMVICGELEMKGKDAIKNPLLIIEVLSESTASYDRGKKFKKYISLPSFVEYVLIEQDQPVVHAYHRKTEQGTGRKDWTMRFAYGLEEKIYLESIDCEIALADIYEYVDFPEGQGIQGELFNG